jgi:DnaK suppressor protein
MTNRELNNYRNQLEAKQSELAQLVRNRDGIVIEKSPDALDEVQYATERDLSIRNLDRDSNLLRNVRGALRRIGENSFGLCPHWGGNISAKRLVAVTGRCFAFSARNLLTAYRATVPTTSTSR